MESSGVPFFQGLHILILQWQRQKCSCSSFLLVYSNVFICSFHDPFISWPSCLCEQHQNKGKRMNSCIIYYTAFWPGQTCSCWCSMQGQWGVLAAYNCSEPMNGICIIILLPSVTHFMLSCFVNGFLPLLSIPPPLSLGLQTLIFQEISGFLYIYI